MASKEYYQQNKETVKARSRKYYYEHLEERRAFQTEHRKNNPRQCKANNVKSKFGISLEEYEQRLKDQDYKCKICKVEIPLGKDSHLDHCHRTGKLRGFLCKDCNKGLGIFKDNPEYLNFAIQYLKEYQCF